MPKQPGQRIGRYIIDRRLGVGGMAEAYLAHQEGPAGFVKPVVVKVLQSQHATEPKMVELFLREARVGARLNHANIVQIFDLGQAEGEHYIAMEYVDGLSLLQITRRCWALGVGIPIDVAVRVIAASAVGLQYAHTLKAPDGAFWGIIHRDISPDNIMIARDGTVKILDFGVAKLRGSESTQTGEIKGKIPFMSPEQLEATIEIDARTDLWALGVTLYWCLVGKRPFSAPADVHVIRKILEEKPVRPSETNKVVPAELDDIVMNLLEKDREQRPQNAAKLAARLQRVLPPTQGNPLAKFIEKMAVYDDDPPENRIKTGGTKGIPASPALRDSTDIVVRDVTEHAELVNTDEAFARRDTMLIADTTLSNSDDDEVPSTGGSGNHAATVLVARREAVELRKRNRRRALPIAAALVAVLAIATVVAISLRPQGTTNAVDAGVVASLPVVASAPPPVPEIELFADGGVEEAEPPVVPIGDPPRASVATRAVQASAPERIRWTTNNGRPLGSGTKTLQVPETERTIIALDPKHDARVVVAVAAKIDWATLPEATITVRVLPYATEVKIGNDSLGPTPVQPRTVVAGVSAMYRVIATKDKVTMTKVVKLKPGEDQVVAIDLRR